MAEGHSKQRGPREQDGKELVLLVGHREEQGSWRHNKRGGMWWEVWKPDNAGCVMELALHSKNKGISLKGFT